MIDYSLNKYLKTNVNGKVIECGIGIDYGKVLVTQVGMYGLESDENRENEVDCVWAVSYTHLWDANKQIVADMDESDWYNAEVYVRGTNLLAKFSKQSGNVKTDYQYYTQNAHGDVVNLTDADGAITKSYTYDAFCVEQNID